MAINTHMDMKLYQMDVKMALLNGVLREDIYTQKVEGLKIQEYEKKNY